MSFIQQTESYYKHKEEVYHFERSKDVYSHDFIFDASDLTYLTSNYDDHETAKSLLAQMGGVEGIAYALRTDMSSGLGEDEVGSSKKGATGDDDEALDALQHRRSKYGANEVKQRPAEPFWRLCLDELEDPMLKVLIVAGIASIIVGVIDHPEEGWIDGCAILLAVVIVVCVGAFNNFQKEKQFRKQEEESKKKDCIVLRNGEEKEIPFREVVVGDLVILRSGFAIPADGIFVLGTENLKAEQAGLTGESKELSKNRKDDPLLMKGTNIVSGEGLMIAVAVGNKTVYGKLMEETDEERTDTPLQEKLDTLGRQIGWGGTAVAIVIFLILLIVWLIESDDYKGEAAKEVVDAFIIAVTIVVVAVPEGLPLAVTISLAYSMKKMLIDNNFVRHLAACETMGNATTICSDKTGTLTTNRMSVSKCHLFGEQLYTKLPSNLKEKCESSYQRLITAVISNTTSFQDVPRDENERKAIEKGAKPRLTGGNQTDCAMLQWAIDLGGANYKEIREKNASTKFWPFDSKVKRSSVLCKDYEDKSRFVMYVKGAAEQVIELCKYTVNDEGKEIELNDEHKKSILGSMDLMTRSGLRCVASCYRMYAVDEIPFKSKVSYTLEDSDCDILFESMVWMSVCGIADPVRPEVPAAVATCQKAGIIVRMVTGDHLETAKHIAKQCGILTCADHVCMEGKEFRDLSDDDKKEYLPRLRVLARSKPEDKMHLVQWYKEYGSYGNGVPDIVAVTGDGANDAPALTKADVGLSMGIQGTDVAKEASDIIIMDDNFASIEKTVMWGRSVYDNIRKFVQFQLTVNVTALTISVIGAFFTAWKNPLTAVQLLWVNLIMDTMAALALATEDPTRALLERYPFKKDSHLITKVLWRFVFGHSIYQLVWLILTLQFGVQWLDIPADMAGDNHDIYGRNLEHLTVVFNVFVWMQIFNEFNARKVNNEWNVFDGVFKNPVFWLIIVITVVAQFLLVQFVGRFASTYPLNATEWGYCIAIGAGALIWHQLVRLFPIDLNDGRLDIDTETLFKVEEEFDQYKIKIDKNDGNDDNDDTTR